MTDNTSKTASTTGALFLSILGALMAVTSLSTDIYLPAILNACQTKSTTMRLLLYTIKQKDNIS